MKKADRFFNWYAILSAAMILLLLIGAINILHKPSTSMPYPQGSLYADTAEGRVCPLELLPADAGPDAVSSVHTPPVSLPKGLYDITLSYQCTDGGSLWIAGNGAGPNSYYAQNQELDPRADYKRMQIWVNDPLDSFTVNLSTKGGSFLIGDMTVTESANSRLYQCVCLALPLLLVDLLCACFYFRRRLEKYAVAGVGLAVITLIASLGLFTRYMPFGHDLQFHLLRIEGLKDGLLSGAFPVRIQPNWVGGWGYAVSIMYGDLTILFPALLRMIGFTVQTSYKAFLVAITFLTALSSYYTFHQICKNQNISLLGSLLYTTAPYRLCCILTRGAFGEYCAMMFLPLIALGFWRAFGEDAGAPGYGKKFLLPAVGLAGLIQTHILTCQMAALFILPLCLILWRKVIVKRTFFYLAKFAGFAALLSAWFLVPFLQYYREDLLCTNWSEMPGDYQLLGASLTELFAPEASGYFGYSWSELTPLNNKFSIPLSNALLLFLLVALIVLWKRQLPGHKRAVSIVFGMSAAAVWLSTNLFPYELIREHFPKLASFLAKPGLPYRYLSPSCLLLSLLAVLILWQLGRKSEGASASPVEKYVQIGALLLVAAIAVNQSMAFTYRCLYGGTYCVYYDGNELNTGNLVGGEYLYNGSSAELAMGARTVAAQNAAVSQVSRHYNSFDIQCQSGTDAALDIPLFCYPGYFAEDSAGKALSVTRGDNSRVRVSLPDNYSGQVHVGFREPVLWRLAEAVSLLSILLLVYLHLPSKFQRVPLPAKRTKKTR